MKILVAGDFVPRCRTAAQIEKDDFSCLEEVKPIIQSADYAIVNFESPVVMREAKPIEKTGPNLRCTEKAMECVAQAGFKCVTLANNHFRDFGQVGVEDTLQACKKFSIDYVGGGKDLDEAERILYQEIDGQRLAIINICENEWSIASEIHGGSAPLNLVKNYYAIQEAQKNADFVLVVVHGGKERYYLPTPRMQDTYRYFIDIGADAVVNHHQHCYSGYEVYNGRPIFYGLGNFSYDKITPRNDKMWEEGYMVELIISTDISFKIYPYIQAAEDLSAVHPIQATDAFLNSLTDINGIIVDRTKLFEEYISFAEKNHGHKDILIPYSSSVAKKLCDIRVLPSFLSKSRLIRLLAYIQCESHRDLIIEKLKTELSHYHEKAENQG
jgi:poly-gamma-glutamate synthesis protein (capsule biosynthesis protein)